VNRTSEKNLIVGLDIGTSKVVAIVGEVSDEGNIEVVGIGSHPSRGLKKGVVVNIESTVHSIQRAVEEAELMAGLNIETAVVGIAGGHIRSFNSRGVVAVAGRDRTIVREDVKRVMEAARAVSIPQDREVLHVLPQEFVVDNEGGIESPIGLVGAKLEANVHIVTAATTSKEPIIQGEWLEPGMHVNGIGANSPAKQELAPSVYTRGRVVVDYTEQVLMEAGDLMAAIESGDFSEADIAAELGCRAVLLAEVSGGGSFDEAFAVPFTRLAERFPEHPIPAACLSGTVEFRGQRDVSDALAEADAGALFRSLQRHGLIGGDPGPLPEPLCEATRLDACEFLKAPAPGILSYAVELGERVAAGDVVAWLIDPAAEDPNQGRRAIRAGTDGLVLSRRDRLYVLPGATLAKIVGTETLPERRGRNLLGD